MKVKDYIRLSAEQKYCEQLRLDDNNLMYLVGRNEVDMYEYYS